MYSNIIKNSLGTHEYTENHHIIPRCLGGSDSKENIVKLSAKEHFICHLLLTKMYPTSSPAYYKMVKACLMMSNNNRYQKRYTGKVHEKLRIQFSKAQSILQSGTNNSNYGTKWIHNVALRQSKKIPNSTEVPDGWASGRVVIFAENKVCPVCKNKFRDSGNKRFCNKQCAKLHWVEPKVKYYTKMYNLYKSSKSTSIRKFAKTQNVNASSLCRGWKLYVTGYKV